MTLIEAIRQRPASSERSSRSISRSDDAVNRSTSAGPVPRVLRQLYAADRQALLDGDVEVGELALALRR